MGMSTRKWQQWLIINVLFIIDFYFLPVKKTFKPVVLKDISAETENAAWFLLKGSSNAHFPQVDMIL